MTPKTLLRKTTRFILIVLAAFWIMFEEWVWDSIMAVMERIGRLRIVNRIEAHLVKQNPYLLLSLFLFPFFIMLPAKIYGLYLIANGMVIRGVSIFILAKVVITALLTRLFYISKDSLMRIRSFATSYTWVREKKEWVYEELNKNPAWQAARKHVTELKRFAKETIGPFTRGSGLVARIKGAKQRLKAKHSARKKD